MSFTELTAETIERDYCSRCQNFVDKRFIYKDYGSGYVFNMGTIRECKYRTDKDWICDFKEVDNGNDD